MSSTAAAAEVAGGPASSNLTNQVDIVVIGEDDDEDGAISDSAKSPTSTSSHVEQTKLATTETTTAAAAKPTTTKKSTTATTTTTTTTTTTKSTAAAATTKSTTAEASSAGSVSAAATAAETSDTLEQSRSLLQVFCAKHLDDKQTTTTTTTATTTVGASSSTSMAKCPSSSAPAAATAAAAGDFSSSSSNSGGGAKGVHDLARLRDQIWELFSAERTDIGYLKSAAFRNKVRIVDSECCKWPQKKRVHVKELIDNMLLHTPKTEDQRKIIETNKKRLVAKSNDKLIDKLGEKLQEIVEKINKVEREDGFEDDEEEADDAVERECNYVYLDRLKKRAVELYNKIQELMCNPSTTLRESRRPVVLRCTAYPEVNRAVGKMATRCARKDLAPDFSDVLTVVRRVNSSENLGMSDERQRSVAVDVFKEVVQQLKKRRIKETRLNMESLEIEFGEQSQDDPAEKDAELEARLKASEAQGREKIAAVINDFADRQTNGDGELGKKAEQPKDNLRPPSSNGGDVDDAAAAVASTSTTDQIRSKEESENTSDSLRSTSVANGTNASTSDEGGEDGDADDDDTNDESEIDESYLQSGDESTEDEQASEEAKLDAAKAGLSEEQGPLRSVRPRPAAAARHRRASVEIIASSSEANSNASEDNDSKASEDNDSKPSEDDDSKVSQDDAKMNAELQSSSDDKDESSDGSVDSDGQKPGQRALTGVDGGSVAVDQSKGKNHDHFSSGSEECRRGPSTSKTTSMITHVESLAADGSPSADALNGRTFLASSSKDSRPPQQGVALPARKRLSSEVFSEEYASDGEASATSSKRHHTIIELSDDSQDEDDRCPFKVAPSSSTKDSKFTTLQVGMTSPSTNDNNRNSSNGKDNRKKVSSATRTNKSLEAATTPRAATATTADSCGDNFLTRQLRRLGTNIVPVVKTSGRSAPEVIEIDSDD